MTTNNTETQRVIRNYNEQLHAKIFEILGEIDEYIKKHNPPKLSQEEAESPNRTIRASEIEAAMKKILITQKPWTRQLHRRILQNIQGRVNPNS